MRKFCALKIYIPNVLLISPMTFSITIQTCDVKNNFTIKYINNFIFKNVAGNLIVINYLISELFEIKEGTDSNFMFQ